MLVRMVRPDDLVFSRSPPRHRRYLPCPTTAEIERHDAIQEERYRHDAEIQRRIEEAQDSILDGLEVTIAHARRRRENYPNWDRLYDDDFDMNEDSTDIYPTVTASMNESNDIQLRLHQQIQSIRHARSEEEENHQALPLSPQNLHPQNSQNRSTPLGAQLPTLAEFRAQMLRSEEELQAIERQIDDTMVRMEEWRESIRETLERFGEVDEETRENNERIRRNERNAEAGIREI